MGVSGSKAATTKEIKEVKQTVTLAVSEDKLLFDKILKKSKDLYQINKMNFLDENFCKKIAVTYTKKLYELPIQQIRDVFTAIEGSNTDLEISTVYDPLDEEKFLVNELSGKLVDHFKGKKFHAMQEQGIKITFPDIAYIQNNVLDILNDINKIEKEKLVGGRRFNNENINYNNENNNNNNNDNNSNGNNNSNRNNNNSNRNNTSNSNNNNNNNNNSNNENENENSEMNKRNRTDRYTNNLQRKKKDLDDIMAEYEETRKKGKDQRFQKEYVKPRTQMEPPRELKDERNKAQKANNYNYKKLAEIESNGDIHCVEGDICKLTKKEMCEKIVLHFIIRNNIIAAILSTIPLPSKDGKYSGSFPFERLKSLEKGTFCLPPYDDIKYHKTQIDNEDARKLFQTNRRNKILDFINLLDEKQCVGNGGRLLVLNAKQMEKMYRDDTLGRKYFDFAMKINNFYQNSLIALYDILENLQNNVKISTANLNDISEKTKKIIDELYLKTQFNYLLAVMVVLDFKFDDENPEVLLKNERIQEIIKADLKA